MNLKKLAGLAVIAFLVFYTVTNPHEAAQHIHTITAGITAFASALASGGN